MTDQNKTIARTIRMYPHEWAQVEKHRKALTRNLHACEVKGEISVSRLFAFLTADPSIPQCYDAVDIVAYTYEARAKDAKRRKRAV